MTSQKIGEITRYIPEYVLERTTYRVNDVLNPTGEYILYWMHSAMRLVDNPSLDLCSLLSAQLQKPIVIVQVQASDQPHLNKRHFTFIAEGAKDVATEAIQHNLSYNFYFLSLEKKIKLLMDYARQATVIVTDDVPINYQRSVTTRLQDNTATPLMRVDASCIIPLPLLKKKFASKEEFRRETTQLRGERMGRSWQSWQSFFKKPATLFTPPSLTTPAIDLKSDVVDFLRNTDDAGVMIASVKTRRGGSKAGNVLWQKAKQTIFSTYPVLEDNGLLGCYAVLAPYLRYGMISPFKILFDTTIEGTDAAWHFLEYFLVQRDYAYAFCYNNALHDNSLIFAESLKKELKKFEEGRTPDSLPLEFERDNALTNNPQWNRLQQTLKKQGFLPEHFFKEYVTPLKNWSGTGEKLVSFIRENYDRYALDAYDPLCSYNVLCGIGAIVEPAATVGGQAPLVLKASHRILEKTTVVPLRSERRIAIIGAGIAGLSCAWHLQREGIKTTIFEEASSAGGRIATHTHKTSTFDVGTPFFTANHPYFKTFIEYWEKKGKIERWKGQIYVDNRQAGLNLSKHPFVGISTMEKFINVLQQQGQEIFYRHAIKRIDKVSGGWRLFSDTKDCGFFDDVIIALPAPLSHPLLKDATTLQVKVERCLSFTSVWVVMAGFAQKLPTEYDALAIANSPVTYAFRENNKPHRAKNETWVLHGNVQWTRENMGVTEDYATQKIAGAFLSHLKASTLKPTYTAAKLWKHAYVEKPLGQPCLFSDGIGVCGDWLLGRRVEDAFLSGASMAAHIINA
jgi:predicted NAD/FAD-dependent oxidoreductase/deoxyribodipyrimidine photolyase